MAMVIALEGSGRGALATEVVPGPSDRMDNLQRVTGEAVCQKVECVQLVSLQF